MYAARGLNPSSIGRGLDGNPVFRVIGPDDATLDFIQYAPGSKQTLARGKFLDPRRVSTHLQHVGIYTKNRESVVPFYQDKLGFARGRDVPGTRGDYIETPSSDRNTRDEVSAAGSEQSGDACAVRTRGDGGGTTCGARGRATWRVPRSRAGTWRVDRPPSARARRQQPALADAPVRSGRLARRSR